MSSTSLHAGFFMTIADDLEGLHHRNAADISCELAGEHRDVRGQNLAAGSKRGAWCLDARGRYAWRLRSARNAASSRQGICRAFIAAFVLAFPQKLVSFLPAVADIAINRSLRLPANRW